MLDRRHQSSTVNTRSPVYYERTKLRTRQWKRRTGEGTWEGARAPRSLGAALPHGHVFTARRLLPNSFAWDAYPCPGGLAPLSFSPPFWWANQHPSSTLSRSPLNAQWPSIWATRVKGTRARLPRWRRSSVYTFTH